jgi:hypothetical protein
MDAEYTGCIAAPGPSLITLTVQYGPRTDVAIPWGQTTTGPCWHRRDTPHPSHLGGPLVE